MELFHIISEPNGAGLSLWEICARLICAMMVGLVIGGEREFTHRPAGMRTHMLVALGACTVMITGQLVYAQYNALGANPDPSRLSAQVISGVGFLGAGTILREGASIKGLTTAASLWAVACLGIAAGGGYYSLTIASTICSFLILSFFEKIQRKLVDGKQFSAIYSGISKDITQAMEAITAAAGRNNAILSNLESYREENGQYRFSFRASFNGLHVAVSRGTFFSQLAATRCIYTITENPDEK